jgi:hypothetical protein
MPPTIAPTRESPAIGRNGMSAAGRTDKAAASASAPALRLPALPNLPSGVAPLDLSRIATPDLLQSLRDVVSLLRNGVDRQRVFLAVGASTPHPVLAEVLQNIGQRTQAGSSLYQALAAWPSVFDEVVIRLVRHGEGENQLATCIKAVHAYLEYRGAMQSLVNTLPATPEAWRRPALEQVAHARLFAALAVGEQVGLAKDEGVPMAARQCGDANTQTQVLTAWEASALPLTAHTPDQRLQQTLVKAGIVGGADWAHLAQRIPGAEMSAMLQQLALQQSAKASRTIDQLTQRITWGRRNALRAALVVAAALLTFAVIT